MHSLFPRSGAPARLRRLAAVVLSTLLAAVLFAPAAPAAAADAPVLTQFQPPAAPVVFGQPGYVGFTASAPATQVWLQYIDELKGQVVHASWDETQPAGRAVLDVPSTAYTGVHQLLRVSIYANGVQTTYTRGSEPPGAALLSTGDIQIDNPYMIVKDFDPWTPQLKAEQSPALTLSVANPPKWPYLTSLSYQWMRSGQPIVGAKGLTYSPPEGDRGDGISLRATAYNTGYRTATFTSPEYVSPKPLSVAPIVMAGLPTPGGVLHPEFTSQAPVSGGVPGTVFTYDYTWKRDGAVIPGADQPLYPVGADDAYRTLSVDLTVSYDGGASATTVSTRAVRITAAPRTRGFDADGTADVFARTADGTLMLYPGDGRGGWKAARAIGWGWGGFDALVAPGDFDGDGATDVIGRDRSGRLFLYSGDGAGGWKGGRQIGQGWGGFLNLVAAGDVNGDGTNDLVARDASAQMWLYPGDGRGGWLAPSVIGWGWWDYSGLTSTGDFNGDLATDVVGIDKYAILRLFPTNGQGGFGANAGAPIGTDWRGLAYVGGPGDFNGDGDADLFAVDGAGRLTMYWGNAGLKGRFYGAVGDWKGASTVGWGWGGFTAVF